MTFPKENMGMNIATARKPTTKPRTTQNVVSRTTGRLSI
jgi:hypothetical protein